MADQLTLEILIKTTLEGRGVSPTTEEIKQLANEIKAATPAGQQFNLQQEALVKRVGELREAAKSAAPSVGQIGEAAKKVSDGAKATTPAIRELGDELNRMKQAGAGISQVFSGLQQGGLGGLRQAANGATQTIRSLVAGSSTAFLSVAGLVAGAGAAGLIALNRLAKQNQDEINKWYDEAQKNAAARKSKIEELTQATTTAVATESAKIGELQKSYSELEEQIGAVRQQIDDLTKSQYALKIAQVDKKEAQDLAKLQTDRTRAQSARVAPLSPDQQAIDDQQFAAKKAAIQADAAGQRQAIRNDEQRTDIVNKKLRADQDVRTAEERQSQQQALVDSLQKIADAAKQQAEESKRLVEEFRRDHGDRSLAGGDGQKLRNDAAAKAAAAKDAADKVTEASKPLDDLRRQTDAKKDAAKALAEKTQIDEQTITAARAALEAQQKAAYDEQRLALSTKILADIAERQAAEKSGDTKGAAAAAQKRVIDTADLDALNAQEFSRRQRVIDDARLDAQTRTSAAERKIAAAKEKEAIDDAQKFADQTRKDAIARGDDVGATAAARAQKSFEDQGQKVSGKAAPDKEPNVIKNSAGEVVTPAQTSAEPPRRSSSQPGAGEIQQEINKEGAAIAATQPAPALDVTPVKDAFGQYHQRNVQAHQESKQAIGTQGQQIVDLAKELAQLKITVSNQADLAQAATS